MAGSGFISLLKPTAVDGSAEPVDAKVFDFSPKDKVAQKAPEDNFQMGSEEKSLKSLESGGVSRSADVLPPSARFFRS